MQGDEADPLYDGRWAKAIATCKHYDAYSLENFNNQAAPAVPPPVVSKNDEICIKNEEFCIKNEKLCNQNDELCITKRFILQCAPGGACDRVHFNAIVSDQELAETYLPAFTRGCVQGGGTRSIMCSCTSSHIHSALVFGVALPDICVADYTDNAVNGVPSCANSRLNNHVLRDEYNFRGYVVSDCGGVSCIQNAHHYTNTTEQTCAAGLQGGCDLDCGATFY